MTRKTFFLAAFGLWAILFILSFVLPKWATSDLMGLDAGFKRMSLFLSIQCFVVIMAILCWALGRGANSSGMRWLARFPGLVALAMVATLGAVILWVVVLKPEPVVPLPTGPTTKPAVTSDG